jgi:hypothetical protein
MRRKKKRTWLVLLIILVVGYVIFYNPAPKVKRPAKPHVKAPAKRHRHAVKKKIPSDKPATVPQEHLARVSIVIDDMGQDVRLLDEVISLNMPVSVAVLPYQRYSSDISRKAGAAGLDVLLHLPMQAREKIAGLGQGALTGGMTAQEIAYTSVADLATVPGAVGVNNHMGSGLTEEAAPMRALMRLLDDKGLFFLDSRTSSASVAYKTAQDEGVKAATRDVFLDDSNDPEDIERQFQRMVDIALRRGQAVAIGHPRPATLKVLRERLPGLEAQGIELVCISELMK